MFKSDGNVTVEFATYVCNHNQTPFQSLDWEKGGGSALKSILHLIFLWFKSGKSKEHSDTINGRDVIVTINVLDVK